MNKYVLSLLSVFTLLVSITSASHAMTNMKGQPTSIEAYAGKGKWLIVQAWSSNCSICNKAMPGLVKASRSFPNAKVIGISLDNNASTAKKFINKHRINFPTLLSNNTEFNNYLLRVADEKLKGTPTYLIFNPKGELSAMQPGEISLTTVQNFITGQH